MDFDINNFNNCRETAKTTELPPSAENNSPQKRLKNFKKLKDLGRGAFGICALYKDETSRLNKKVVIKRVSLECQSENDKRAISYEASLLKKLSHPNVIRFYDSFVELEQLCILMEYLDGGTMERMIQERKGIKMGQDLVLYYFTQIVLALDHMHALKILHRDIKTANIFLNRKMTIVKVGDFGISKELNSKCAQASTFVGTMNYVSPEICEGRAYGPKSDVWAVGCVLYELVELHKAFDGDSIQLLLLRIARGQHGPISSTVTPGMRELIENVMEIDENRRPNTTEILLKPMVLQKWMEIHTNLGRIEPDIELYTKETH
ncbi:hypothetical protein niasHS_017948 [Heterodera schachtii]|uniref:non-specific serine/threonine protein kinase n=1 Tax=Heterodera schachtii TaxID=97005 RepID=A0ABD2HXB6_HETSC